MTLYFDTYLLMILYKVLINNKFVFLVQPGHQPLATQFADDNLRAQNPFSVSVPEYA